MKKIYTIFLIFLISIFSFGITGKVIKVSDGDSFLIKSNGKKIRIRMYGVDAPELTQEHGQTSKKELEKMILGKNVKIKIVDEDKYGRKIGRVYYKGKEINLEMLKSGNVWFYEYHAKNEKNYKKAFEEAKKNKIGLWQYKSLENPRKYRLRHKQKEANNGKRA